jgi:cysteine desulfurase
MEALADVVAVSNGSACTSQSQTCSHVLAAMGLAGPRAEGAIRLSWCHLTPEPDWGRVVEIIQNLRR